VVVKHAVGLAGIAAIVVGVWAWIGWPAGVIAAGLPFAGFYLAGQVIEVMRDLRYLRRE
jgi:hypothetical protein